MARRCEDCHGQHDTGAEALWCSFLVGVTAKTLRRPTRPVYEWAKVGQGTRGFVRRRVV